MRIKLFASENLQELENEINEWMESEQFVFDTVNFTTMQKKYCAAITYETEDEFYDDDDDEEEDEEDDDDDDDNENKPLKYNFKN